MKWSDFETRIKPAMLNGKSYVVTIARIVQEQVHPQPNTTETGVAMYFTETSKSLVLNAANRRALWAMFGDDAQAAIGQRVQLNAEPRSRTDSRLTIRIGPATDKPTGRQVDTATGEITATASSAKDSEADPITEMLNEEASA